MSGEHLKIGDYILNPFWEGSKEISINHLNKYYTYPLKYIPIYKNIVINFIKSALILPVVVKANLIISINIFYRFRKHQTN